MWWPRNRHDPEGAWKHVLYSVCPRKPHWPHLTKANCWECAFLSRSSLQRPGPRGVLGLQRPSIGTRELIWASGTHWKACPFRTRAGFCPQEKKIGPAALFLKGPSQVCFQLRKSCHSKVFLLTQKPQGEIGDVFLCPLLGVGGVHQKTSVIHPHHSCPTEIV